MKSLERERKGGTAHVADSNKFLDDLGPLVGGGALEDLVRNPAGELVEPGDNSHDSRGLVALLPLCPAKVGQLHFGNVTVQSLFDQTQLLDQHGGLGLHKELVY